MRRTRRVVGWLLAVLGALLVVGGVACAVWVGPDSTLASGPHRLSSAGSAIVTGDDALDRAGPTVTLSVTTPDGGKVFVGLANAVDVDDYLAGSPVTRVDSVSLPWDVVTTAVDGDSAPLLDPRDLDWWLVSDSGRGSASLSFPLPDQVVDVVVMDPDRGAGLTVDVTAGVEIPGLFAGAIAAGVFGLGLILAGLLAIRRSRASGLGRSDDSDHMSEGVVVGPSEAGEHPSADVGAP